MKQRGEQLKALSRDMGIFYGLAADLTDVSSEKKAAIFLTCVGSEAYDVYRAMELTSADDKKENLKTRRSV